MWAWSAGCQRPSHSQGHPTRQEASGSTGPQGSGGQAGGPHSGERGRELRQAGEGCGTPLLSITPVSWGPGRLDFFFPPPGPPPPPSPSWPAAPVSSLCSPFQRHSREASLAPHCLFVLASLSPNTSGHPLPPASTQGRCLATREPTCQAKSTRSGFPALISTQPSACSHGPPAAAPFRPLLSSACSCRPRVQRVDGSLQSPLPPVRTSASPTYPLSPRLTRRTCGLMPTADAARSLELNKPGPRPPRSPPHCSHLLPCSHSSQPRAAPIFRRLLPKPCRQT